MFFTLNARSKYSGITSISSEFLRQHRERTAIQALNSPSSKTQIWGSVIILCSTRNHVGCLTSDRILNSFQFLTFTFKFPPKKRLLSGAWCVNKNSQITCLRRNLSYGPHRKHFTVGLFLCEQFITSKSNHGQE